MSKCECESELGMAMIYRYTGNIDIMRSIYRYFYIDIEVYDISVCIDIFISIIYRS